MREIKSHEMWEHLRIQRKMCTAVFLAVPSEFVDTENVDERHAIAEGLHQRLRAVPSLSVYARVGMYDYVGISDADLERVRDWAISLTVGMTLGTLDGYWGIARGSVDALSNVERLMIGTGEMARADPRVHVFVLHEDGWVRKA